GERKQDIQQEHAHGKIIEIPKEKGTPGPRRLFIKEVEALCQVKEKKFNLNKKEKENQGGLLYFGPRWTSLKWVKYGEKQALAFLELPEAYAEDCDSYLLHPALLDMATGFLYPHIKANSAYVPFSYKKLRIYNRLPRRILSYSRYTGDRNGGSGQEILTFDITIMDQQGNELVDIREFTMLEVSREIKNRIETVRQHVPAATAGNTGVTSQQEAEDTGYKGFLKHGLLPLEGIETLDWIMNAEEPRLTRVVVSATDLAARLEPLHRPGSAPQPGTSNKSGGDLPKYARPEMKSAYAAPGTGTEKKLAAIWEEFLGIKNLGIHDDFFELGGDSLKAINVGGKIHKEFHKKISLTDLGDTKIGRASRAAVIVVSLVDGLSPLIASMIVLLPFFFAALVGNVLACYVLSLIVAMIGLFGLGMFLGQISGRNL
ncbi:MAG: hypothetical protein GY950_22490, partial [bacterium]|nr:hypothetical protein [bacterium]